jgi:hypothetical protein
MIDLADTELEDLLGGLAKYHGDPLGFVTNAFPWGEGELIRASGPEEWQAEILLSRSQWLRDTALASRLLLRGLSFGRYQPKPIPEWLLQRIQNLNCGQRRGLS